MRRKYGEMVTMKDDNKIIIYAITLITSAHGIKFYSQKFMKNVFINK